jgi:hypothetical protein
MNKYDKAIKALEHAGFSPEKVGTQDDICIYVNVWNDAMSEAHEMRLHDTEIGWWATKYEKELVS